MPVIGTHAERDELGRDGARGVLRGLPVLTAKPPPFIPDQAPDDPVELFLAWLDEAIRVGVAEPHAMTVSTIGPTGCPDARVQILKAVDQAGWHFAASSVSQKGRDLAARPVAALTFYWPAQLRQVRINGPVLNDGPRAAAEDFLARPRGSRLMALTRRQSHPFTDPAEVDDAVDKASHELDGAPDLVPEEWVSYAVAARQVEFWQGDPQRRHQRLRYETTTTDHTQVTRRWSRTLLWP